MLARRSAHETVFASISHKSPPAKREPQGFYGSRPHKKIWLKPEPPIFETSFENTKANVELDCFSVYIKQWFCASDRREELNYVSRGVDFWPQEVDFGFEKSIKSIFGPWGIDIGPLRVNFRALKVDFWSLDTFF